MGAQWISAAVKWRRNRLPQTVTRFYLSCFPIIVFPLLLILPPRGSQQLSSYATHGAGEFLDLYWQYATNCSLASVSKILAGFCSVAFLCWLVHLRVYCLFYLTLHYVQVILENRSPYLKNIFVTCHILIPFEISSHVLSSMWRQIEHEISVMLNC